MKRKTNKRKKISKKVRKATIIFLIIICVLLLAVLGVVLLKAVGKQEEKADNSDNQEDSAPEADYVEYDRVDAPYEHWLAATVITGISMENPDFELGEIYAAEETSLEEAQNSEGIYVVFTSDGEENCVYSAPLEEARTEAGTTDITSNVIGFASFEEVTVDSIDTSKYHVIEIEDLNTIIEQSERVTVYTN